MDSLYPLRGMALRRHTVALLVQSLACRIRGYHTPEYDKTWKDTFCSACWILLDD